MHAARFLAPRARSRRSTQTQLTRRAHRPGTQASSNTVPSAPLLHLNPRIRISMSRSPAPPRPTHLRFPCGGASPSTTSLIPDWLVRTNEPTSTTSRCPTLVHLMLANSTSLFSRRPPAGICVSSCWRRTTGIARCNATGGRAREHCLRQEGAVRRIPAVLACC